jgi:hypothetical protein
MAAVFTDPLITQIMAKNDNFKRGMREARAVHASSADSIERRNRQLATNLERDMRRAGFASQNLGRQIADVGTSLASGSSPFLVIAQQAPQMADALAGTTGVAGRMATFFAGPWGAALLAAGSVLGVLAGNLIDTQDETEKVGTVGKDMAEKFGDAAADVAVAADAMDRALGSVGDTARDVGNGFAQFGIDVAGAMAKATNEVADFVQRTNGLLPRAIDKLLLAGTPAGDNIQLLNPSILEAQRRAQERRLQGLQADRALANTPGNRAFGVDPFRDGEFRPFDAKSLEAFGEAAGRAREDAEREAERLADTQEREAKRAADAAAREAERAQKALEASLQKITAEFDPARKAAEDFRDTIAEINKLETSGVITAANAATFRFEAARQQAEAVARAATERLGELDQESGFNPEAIIKGASNRVDAERDANRAIAEDEAQLRETNVRNLASLYEDLLLGGTRNVWDTFKRIGIRVIAETLANFTLGGGGGGGIGAAFTAALGAVFGRNSGGYVAPRQTVRVNEQRGGAEFLRMGAQGGTVIPLGQINQAAARPMASGGVATVRLELSGDIDARIQSVSAGVAVEVVRGAAPAMIDAAARETTARLSRRRI